MPAASLWRISAFVTNKSKFKKKKRKKKVLEEAVTFGKVSKAMW